MNLNFTLLGEMLTFMVFVWFTMRFIWPPLTRVLEERREKIAAGIAASEKSQRDLELAQQTINAMMNDAKTQIALLIDSANQRGNHIINDARNTARIEADRLLAVAKEEIQREVFSARAILMNQLSALVVSGAEKILQHEVNKSTNDRIIADLVRDAG